MRKQKMNLPESLRIIFTIAAKDLRDLIRNRIMLILLMGLGMMMSLSYGASLLARGTQKPMLAIFDSSGYELIDELALQDNFILINAPSEARLTEIILESRSLIIGIILTEDIGEKIAAVEGDNRQPIELAAYSAPWTSAVKRHKRERFFEDALSRLFQTKIQLQSEGNIVYPDRNSRGQPFMVAIYLTIGILFSAAATAPNLMVEEKQSKTLDSLLVSPANYVQIVISKFITGLVPGLIAGLLILGINYNKIIHWPFAFLILLLGDAMVVLIGLWIGLRINHPINLSLFQLVVLILVLSPILIATSLPPHWPALIRGVVNYFPSAAFSRLMRDALTWKIHFSTILPDVLSLVGCGLIFFGLLVRQLSRLDR